MNDKERDEIRTRFGMFMEELLDEFSELPSDEIKNELKKCV